MITGSRRSVVVVGAGLIGPALAVLLSRRGHKVTLYEAHADPRLVPPPPGRSVHLVISARGWHTLETIGLAERVRAISMPLTGRVAHHKNGAQTPIPYGRPGQAIYAVNRAALNRAILEGLSGEPNIELAFGHRCVGLGSEDGVLHFDTQAGRQEVAADCIFATDGAHSAVRRSLLDQERLDYSQTYLPFGHKELTIPAKADGTHLLDPSYMHLWPRNPVMLTAFPNLDGTFSATLLMPHEGEESFEALRSPEQLAAFAEQRFHDLVPSIPNLAEDFFSRPTTSVVTNRCFPWNPRPRLLFLGDAAHTMVPFLGQGMNAGLEDCAILVEMLDRAQGEIHTVFPDFQRKRKADCDAVTEMALAHFRELSSLSEDRRFLLRKRLEQKAHRLRPERFVSLYAMIAFTRVSYADARRIAQEQEAIMDQLMALPDIEARCDDEEVERRLLALLDTLPKRDIDPMPEARHAD